jgi:hypothetical protein
MSSETPIFELKTKLTITINKNAELEAQTIEIERAKVKQKEWKYPSAKTYEPVKLEEGVPSYIKYLLHDFISQTTYPKSCYISYIYMSTSDTTYICYDAVSVKHEQDVKETIAPASFIQVNKELSPPFTEVEKIFTKILAKQNEKPRVHAQTKKAETFVSKFLKKCAHVKINAKFIKIHNEGDEYNFTIDQKIKFFRYPWGEHLLVLPVPELPDPGKSPKHGQLLGIRSDNGQPDVIWGDVWKSLVKLNSILRTPGKKKIFIKGEPGSGKEVFANAIHYGSVRSKPDKLEVRSVAGANTKELRELLFGREIDGVNIAGLIEKADGGTLFLDEFDKIKGKKFYSELLRVLEAEEYVPVNGKKTRKVGDVNWIFAGAFMGTDSSNPTTDLPQDFWSRLTSLIDIKNPITFDRKNDYYSYAGVMFLYFFIQEVVKTGGGVERITSTSKKGDFRSHIARLFIDIDIDIDQELLKVDYANLINEIMTRFQAEECGAEECGARYAGINDGQYFWSGKEKKDKSQNNRCQEGKNTRWSYLYNKQKVPCKGCDSVRSIRQAAKVAFARCFNAALGLKKPSKETFWPNNKNEKEKIYKPIIKEAAETVFITRPGKQYKVRGKKTDAKG